MIEKLRAELKAIHDWPTGNLPTDTEKIAVVCRELRAQEIARKVAEIASKN
jgi:hypothetical protein